MDALAAHEAALAALPAHHRIAHRLEVHLDARLGFVVERHVAPIAQLEVGAEQAIEVAQHVEVEGGSDAEFVIVGGLEQRAWLDQIHADQQRAVGTRCACLAQQAQGRLGREVADARAGIEDHRGAVLSLGRQR